MELTKSFCKWQKEDLFVARLAASTIQKHLPENYNWNSILKKTKAEKVASLFFANASNLKLQIPEDISQKFKEISLAITSKNILKTCEAKKILGLLGENNIRSIILKGIFLANFIYQDMVMRDMEDIDILVETRFVKKVDKILKGLGYHTNDNLEAQDNFSSYRNSAFYVKDTFKIEPIFIHLHWHIVNASLPLFFYSYDIEEIWERAKLCKFGDVSVYLLAPEHLMPCLAEHLMKHSFVDLIYVLDLLFLIRQFEEKDAHTLYKEVFSRINWDEVLVKVEKWNLKYPLIYSLFFISEILGAKLPSKLNSAYKNRAHGFEARYFINCLKANRRWNGLSIFGYLSSIKNPFDKLKFIFLTIFPPSKELKKFGKGNGLVIYLRRIFILARILCQILEKV